MRKSEGGERHRGRRTGDRSRRLGILAAIALALSAAGCNNAIPDVQVTPDYVGLVQHVVGSDPTGSILEMTDGTTQTIDLKAQRSVWRLPYVGAGDLLLRSNVPGSLGAAALSPCGNEPDCWSITGGGKGTTDGYVLTEQGFRLKKSVSFSSWVANGIYPSNGNFTVNQDGELISYG